MSTTDAERASRGEVQADRGGIGPGLGSWLGDASLHLERPHSLTPIAQAATTYCGPSFVTPLYVVVGRLFQTWPYGTCRRRRLESRHPFPELPSIESLQLTCPPTLGRVLCHRSPHCGVFPEPGPLRLRISEPDSALGEVTSCRVVGGRHLSQVPVRGSPLVFLSPTSTVIFASIAFS